MARAAEPKKKSGCIGGLFKLGLVGFLGLFILIVAISTMKPRVPGPGDRPGPELVTNAPAAPSGPSLIPEVAAFFAAHAEFGKPISSSDVPRWAEGKRQNVETDKGEKLLFYEKGGNVVTVYRNDPPNPRVVVWGEMSKP